MFSGMIFSGDNTGYIDIVQEPVAYCLTSKTKLL